MRLPARRAPQRGGLRTKIILWFLIPTVLVLGVVAVLAYSTAQRGTRELVFSRSEDRARLLASQLSGELASYRQTLSVVAAEAGTGDDGGTGAGDDESVPLSTAFAAWPSGPLSTFGGGALLLDRQGTVRAATTGLEELMGTRVPVLLATATWDLDLAGRQDLGYSNVLFDIADDLDAVAVSAANPIVEDPTAEEPAAALALIGLFRVEQQAVRASTFYGRIWELYIGRMLAASDASAPDGPLDPGAFDEAVVGSQRFPQPEIAYLVDGEGIVIFHPDTFMIGADFSGRDVVAGVTEGRLGPVRTESPAGQDVVAAAARVPGTPWLLVTETSWEAVTGSARATTRLMLLLMALGVLLPVLIVTAGVGRITRPLAGLTEAARAVASGRFDQKIELDTGDELETLATQFNTMSAELQASYATLEQRVADRTRELAALNAVASTVSRSLDLEAVLRDALKETLAVAGLTAGAAFRLEEDTLRLAAHQGLSARFVDAVQILSLRDDLPLSVDAETFETAVSVRGTAAAEAVTRLDLVVRRVADYAPGPLRDLLTAEGVQTVVSVPLVARDRAVGVLNLVRRDDVRGQGADASEPVDLELTPEMRSLLAAIGQQVGVAVENALLYAQAEETAALEERNRLARELHDAVSQTLFTASLIADTLPKLWQRHPDEARRQLETLRRLTRGAQAEMRTLLLELRPAALVETDLEVLLGHLGRAVAARADAEVAIDVVPVGPLPADTKIALYRIAQEALNNVVKHAAADHVAVSLRPAATGLVLAIRDDGRGFDPAEVPPDHFGLRTMSERAAALGASLQVSSAVGEGTSVTVHFTL